jgi:hypothetical protein
VWGGVHAVGMIRVAGCWVFGLLGIRVIKGIEVIKVIRVTLFIPSGEVSHSLVELWT